MNKPINKTSTVKAVDGLGNSVRDYIYNPAENKFEHKDDLVHESPLPAAKKADPTDGVVYTSKLDQAEYPIPGTSPAERKAIEKVLTRDTSKSKGAWNNWVKENEEEDKVIAAKSQKKHLAKLIKFGLEESQESVIKNPIMRAALEPKPVQYDKNGYPDKATPKQVGAMAESMEEYRQMTGSDGRYDKPKKKINAYAKVKIPIPTVDHSLLRNPNQAAREAALERTRAYAFSKRPDPDTAKGIGSFRKTIGRKLKAANSKSDWENINQRTYKDNHDK